MMKIHLLIYIVDRGHYYFECQQSKINALILLRCTQLDGSSSGWMWLGLLALRPSFFILDNFSMEMDQSAGAVLPVHCLEIRNVLYWGVFNVDLHPLQCLHAHQYFNLGLSL